MFVDEVTLTLTAGNGGNGVVAWRREKFIPKGGPCGGNGGRGGSIYLQVDPQLSSLEHLRNRRLIRAKNGNPGGYNYRTGKQGEDILVKIPPGTLVKSVNSKQIICDFIQEEDKKLFCKGGKGGKGNAHFKSATHQAPNTCTEGEPGESQEIHLELKLIADIGLIGMPNAGKSSLISSITQLKVKIGAYRFTTLFPNLSYIQKPGHPRLLMADIPGIIEGAHLNKGLGFEFLRHIERSSMLIYVIDISGLEGRSPIQDFLLLQKELETYQPSLLQKPSMIVLNKIDIEGSKENAAEFREMFTQLPVFEISALEKLGLDSVIDGIFYFFEKSALNIR